jgi:hypothetical protein
MQCTLTPGLSLEGRGGQLEEALVCAVCPFPCVERNAEPYEQPILEPSPPLGGEGRVRGSVLTFPPSAFRSLTSGT